MAWTTPRTWVSSEVVTASIGNAHWRDNLNALDDRIRIVRKTAIESVASSTTLQNDDHLFFTAVAGQNYRFRCVLFVTNSGTQLADLKVAFTFPAGTMTFGVNALDTAATSPIGSANMTAIPSATSGTSTIAVAAGSDNVTIIEGFFVCTTGGTVQLQWAQNTSQASATSLNVNSYIEYIRQAT